MVLIRRRYQGFWIYYRIGNSFAHLRPILAIKTKWRFCKASTFTAYRPSGHGQIIQTPLWFAKTTMPLFRYLHKKNILGDGTMSRVPRKRDNQQIRDRVRSWSVRILSADETSFAVVCAAFRCSFYRLGSRCLILLSKFKVPRVNLTSHRTILWNLWKYWF